MSKLDEFIAEARKVEAEATKGEWSTPLNFHWMNERNELIPISCADEDFIAHARNTYAVLLDIVERQAEALDRIYLYATSLNTRRTAEGCQIDVDELVRKAMEGK